MGDEKLKKIINICTGVIMLFILFFVCIQNRSTIRTSLEQRRHTITYDNAKTEFANIEEEYKDGFANRKEWINIFGLTQKLMGRQIINEFSFIQDDYGMLHYIFFPQIEYADAKFVPELCKMEEIVRESGGEFLYVQAPNREALRDCGWIEVFNNEDELATAIVSGLRAKNVSVLDLRKSLLESSDNMTVEDVFFNTDLHMKTDAELWAAGEIASYITEQYQIEFPCMEWLYDMDKYDKKSYPFVGNFGRDAGECYENPDTFDLYFPKEETNFTLYNFVTGEWEDGSFENICMNGMDKEETDKYTYWITDYLRFSVPYYRIVNNNIDGPNVLIMCDSIAFRAVAYLCLTTGSVTILDPRFYNGFDFTSYALQDEYDIVIVYQQSTLALHQIFPSE